MIRALLIAEAANPEWTSVPLVGWSHALALSRLVDAHVVTQIRNQPAFERSGFPAENVTFIDSEALARHVWRIGQALRGGEGKGWTTLTALDALSYPYFERLVWRRFGGRIRAGEFDVVHRITPLSPTIPSPIARKCRAVGVPFVLGPLNGGVPWPPGFESVRRQEREWLSYLRPAYKMVPGHRSTRACASAILVGSRDTAAEVPRAFRDRCIYIPENGIDLTRFPARTDPQPSGPLRVAFVGRLVPYKGADMLLEASLPLLRQRRLVIDVIGDGPERSRLERAVFEARVAGSVAFAGWIDHRQLASRLQSSQVLGFPSIREFGGGVVLEAMALGLVPIVVNYGGPAELVSEGTAIRISLGPRERIVAELRSALARLCDEPGQIAAMSARGRLRVASLFTWDAKAAQVLAVYRWVRGDAPKPNFGMPFPDPPLVAGREAGVLQ